jgi:2-dehydro-3-deoxy-D-arabinonate dehydratase
MEMIRIYKTKQGIVLEQENKYFYSGTDNWDEYINRDELFESLQRELKGLPEMDEALMQEDGFVQAPIGTQEVWAAGVTYLRSKTARMEESRESGGASFYDRVYDAPRPELFFKANPSRVAGTNESVRIRRDSTWNVPEPELTLVISASGKIIGYTIGNDMSSRSIEGENPLYLPQAKTYDRSAALGPCILVLQNPIPSDTGICMTVERSGTLMFEGSTSINQMKRKHDELVEYLFRESSFPQGCYLMTGTCVVPGNEFTLHQNDVVKITIDHIGTLVNWIE